MDMSKVLVSHSNLTNATNAQAVASCGSIDLTWDDNSGSGYALQTDKALVVVLNPVRAEQIMKQPVAKDQQVLTKLQFQLNG